MLLLRSADSIAARLRRNEQGVVVADLPKAAQAILRYNVQDRFYYQIADSYGHRLTGDPVLPLPRHMEDKGPRFRYSVVDGQSVRICRIAVQINPSPDDIWVQVAETLNSRGQLLEQIFLSILVPQLILVALASFSVWLGVKHGLDPLERLGRLLKGRGKLDLSPVDIGNTPGELEPVTKALNQLFLSANSHIKVQRQFIGNAAHQLRTPVTALKTYADYAQRIEDGADLAPVLKQMSEATGRVAHMVNRLLSLARAEESGRKAPEVVDLTAVVDDAAESVVHEALSRGVSMEFDMPNAPVEISADRGDMVEMLTNLLENAIRYTAENGSVWVRLQNSEAITLTVEDNGSGIPDQEKERVFERFYRIPGTNGTGCGLGLSIVAELADANGAKVEILDRPGGGTSIRVTFPAVAK
jgi:two-component system sensor histidine kinase TctE